MTSLLLSARCDIFMWSGMLHQNFVKTSPPLSLLILISSRVEPEKTQKKRGSSRDRARRFVSDKTARTYLQVDSLSGDVGDETKRRVDHLTPSHFGERIDSKINRKQRHRKQCETKDERGVYESSRVSTSSGKHAPAHSRMAFSQSCTFTGV